MCVVALSVCLVVSSSPLHADKPSLASQTWSLWDITHLHGVPGGGPDINPLYRRSRFTSHVRLWRRNPFVILSPLPPHADILWTEDKLCGLFMNTIQLVNTSTNTHFKHSHTEEKTVVLYVVLFFSHTEEMYFVSQPSDLYKVCALCREVWIRKR